MKVLAILAVAAASALAVACTPSDSNEGSSSDNVTSGSTVDGTYMKIFGGRKSYFVFRAGTPNTFFTEFDVSGSTVRANGTFTYGHDDLGDFIELKRLTGKQNADLDATTLADEPDAADLDANRMELPDDITPGEDAGFGEDAAFTDGLDASVPAIEDASVGSDAGVSDPTAAVYDKFHFVRTGKHQTMLTRDSRERTYQFTKITSYCGKRGKLDCADATQKLTTCQTGYTCTAAHVCACGSSSDSGSSSADVSDSGKAAVHDSAAPDAK